MSEKTNYRTWAPEVFGKFDQMTIEAWADLSRSCDVQQRGFGVDRTVLQAQVGVQEQRESFQLRTQQTVLIGLMGQTGSDITKSDMQAALQPESDAGYS